MQRILSALGQAFSKSSLLISTLTLIVLSSLFVFAQQPSLAAQVSPAESQKLTQQERADKASQAANQSQQNSDVPSLREQAYEEELKAEANPIKKYQENLKAERRANPDEGVVQKTVEKAQGLVDKITGND